MSLISLVKIINGKEEYSSGILKSLELINYSFDKKIQNILIKPNLCYYWDNTTGQTTDPGFVAGLIEILREKISHNVNISIIESDASAMKCKYVFKMLGYERIAQKYNVKLVNLSECISDSVKIEIGDQFYELLVPKIIEESDLNINVPKIKYTMEPIKITCALKNIFGCNAYSKKFELHNKLGEYIVAANKAMKFDLCIGDGNIVSGINPRKLGLVMAGKDPVAFDTVASEIAGINPKTIKYLQLASKESLGNKSFSLKGVPISYFKSKYPKKNMEKQMMSLAYRVVNQIGLGKRLGLS